jgi:hypothetical protein
MNGEGLLCCPYAGSGYDLLIAPTRQRGDLVPEIAGN